MGSRVRARAAIGASFLAHLHVNVLSRLLGLLLIALPLAWLLHISLQRLPVQIELDLAFERKGGADFQVSWAHERRLVVGVHVVLVLVAVATSLAALGPPTRWLVTLPGRGARGLVRLGSSSAPAADRRRSFVGPLIVSLGVVALLVPICGGLMRMLQFRAGLIPVTGWFFFLCVTTGILGAAAALAFLVRTWSTRVVAPGFAAILAGTFVCFVLGATAHVVALKPYRELVVHMYVALWGGAFALWLYAHPDLVRAIGEGRSRLIGLVLVQLCAVTVLLEGALRVVAKVRPSQVFAMPQSGAKDFLRMNRSAPGTVVWGMSTNSLGHFDDEFTVRGESPLVAAIGDSFSYGLIPHALHFTTVCEQLVPPVQVANLGLPAIGPPEYLELLVEEALPLRPDLVVINVFVGNDFERGPEHARDVPPWRRVLDGELLYIPVVVPRLIALARQERGMRGQLGQVATPETARSQRVPLDVILQQNPWLEDHTLERASFSEAAFLAMEKSRAVNTCSETGTSFETFYSTFERILVAAGDTPVAVLLLPDEFQVEDPLWDEVERALSHLDLDRFRPQRRVTAWLEEKGVPYEDVLPRLRALPLHDDGLRHAYRKRDTHFNAVGNRAAGEGLAALVSRVLGVPVSADPTTGRAEEQK